MRQVLVDSSVWIDHLKNLNTDLVALIDMHLRNEISILTHDMILAELLLGGIDTNTQIYDLINQIPRLPIATFQEFETFVTSNRNSIKDIGYVDANLLISCILTGTNILTLDKSLQVAAETFDLSC